MGQDLKSLLGVPRILLQTLHHKRLVLQLLLEPNKAAALLSLGPEAVLQLEDLHPEGLVGVVPLGLDRVQSRLALPRPGRQEHPFGLREAEGLLQRVLQSRGLLLLLSPLAICLKQLGLQVLAAGSQDGDLFPRLAKIFRQLHKLPLQLHILSRCGACGCSCCLAPAFEAAGLPLLPGALLMLLARVDTGGGGCYMHHRPFLI
mmetsp:Transcript_25745/g.72039  ORF Transcript_25745/g.72039 Transcript_25745/m.72039 type:complete len:203 (-) Transcript_25745:38-646(-)